MPPHASNAPAFVTNLRLLDLDRYPDWPAITAQVLTAKEAQQDQKHRIRCVEWALYRLFEIWDVEETRNKLQPFFPPLAPLQSLNLRAALYRCLNELKKNGVLGREATIRKTMLDDCKGEKLGEVLVSFSTIVLQTVAAAEKGKPSTISKRLSVASTLSPTEQRSLLPLAIAHKGSLSALLRRKEHMRRHCDGFQKTLDERAVVFGQRKARLEEDSKSCPRASVDPEKLQRAKKQVGLHWHGDPQWLDVLLEGDRVSGHGSRPGTSFERSWVAAQAGSTATQGEPASQGLLTDLEARVTAQAARLRRWTKFRDELAREHESEAIESTFATTSKAGEDFGITFTAHKDLLLDPTKAPNPEWLQGDDVSPLAEVNEYQKLVQSLGQELRDVDEPRKQNQDQIQGRPMQRDHGVNAKPKDTFLQNGLSPWVSKPHKNLKDLAGSQQLVQQSRIDENLSTPRLQDHRNDVSSPRSAKSPHQEPPQSSQPVKAEPSSTAHTVSSRATADAISRGNDTLNTEVDEDDLLAAEIVALTMNAGPSPIKGKPSLAERTRQSMAFTSSRNPALSEELAMQPPLPRASKPLKSSKPAIEADVKSTLLERTRQSMSILPSEPRKAVHKPRPSQRFPTNQFQTPVKSSHRADASNEETPPEQLFSSDVDYASVFKSRPKIAMSPTPSPMPGNTSSVENSLLDSG